MVEEKTEEKTEEKPQAKKVYINLDGKPGQEEERVLIPEENYDGTISSCTLGEFDSFDKKSKVDKFVFQIRLDGYKKDGEEVEVPFFVKAVVTKAYAAGKSNSTLYDLIESAGLLGFFHKNYTELELQTAFQAFVEGNLVGRRVRVQVDTANKKNPDKVQYSKVAKVLRFLDEAPDAVRGEPKEEAKQ